MTDKQKAQDAEPKPDQERGDELLKRMLKTRPAKLRPRVGLMKKGEDSQ